VIKVRVSGAYLLDRLLDATDPDLVALELDVYWATYAGVDPAGCLRQRAGRVLLAHLKDMAADRTFAEVGDGTLFCPVCQRIGGIVRRDRPWDGERYVPLLPPLTNATAG
jgi:hypothetical protein